MPCLHLTEGGKNEQIFYGSAIISHWKPHVKFELGYFHPKNRYNVFNIL